MVGWGWGRIRYLRDEPLTRDGKPENQVHSGCCISEGNTGTFQTTRKRTSGDPETRVQMGLSSTLGRDYGGWVLWRNT